MLPRYLQWFSATFSGAIFFLVRPPLVGNGDLVGFWPALGLGHLRNSGPGPKTEKHNFPVLGVPKRKTKLPRCLGCPQLSYSLRFDQLDPHGQENTKYEDFGPFWPMTAVGTQRNPGAGPKTEKTQFPGARGQREKKSYHAVRDGCPQLCYLLRFDRPDPQGREIAKYGYFRPFWPRTAFGTYRNPGRGLTMEKRNLPALGILKSKRKCYHAIRDGCPQLFYAFTFCPNGTPRAGNRKIRVF